MKTTPPARKEDVKDPIGIAGWPKEKGRDGERTPMQWSAATQAGFTTGTPWLPVPPSAASINVKAEEGDPDSLLTWYTALIHLKEPTGRSKMAPILCSTTKTQKCSAGCVRPLVRLRSSSA